MSWPILNWFRQQSRRDQIALIVCTVVISLALLWVALIKPLNKATDDSLRRLDSSIATLARVKGLAANLQYYESQQKNKPRSNQVSIVGVIDQSSRAAGLNFSSVNPSSNGDQATVRFDNAALESMLQWLYELESSYQAQIEDLRLNGANQAGFVSGSVRIKKQ